VSVRRPGSTDILPVVRASDLDEPATDRCWLVESLWARSGVGIIGGAPKCCKSWLGLDLALSVASSTPCLGRFDVLDPGPVLIYLAEDSPGIVKQRLTALVRHRALELARLPLHVITEPSLRLDLDRDQGRLARTVEAIAPRMLLLDPFVRLHRINENDAGEVSGVLAFLRELQRQHDLAVVVAHHTRKNGPAGTQAGQGLRGSSDFHAWTDSALYLRRLRDHLLVSIEHRAASAPDPISIALLSTDDGDAHLEIVDAQDHEAPPADLPDRILDAIAARGGAATRDALRTALRVRNERLGPALRVLATAGAIVRTSDGWARPGVPVPTIDSKAERNAAPLPLF
jgi:hypothetical protein